MINLVLWPLDSAENSSGYRRQENLGEVLVTLEMLYCMSRPRYFNRHLSGVGGPVSFPCSAMNEYPGTDNYTFTLMFNLISWWWNFKWGHLHPSSHASRTGRQVAVLFSQGTGLPDARLSTNTPDPNHPSNPMPLGPWATLPFCSGWSLM